MVSPSLEKQIDEATNRFHRALPAGQDNLAQDFKALLQSLADPRMPTPQEPAGANVLKTVVDILKVPAKGVRILTQQDGNGQSLMTWLHQAAVKATRDGDSQGASNINQIAQQSAVLGELMVTLGKPEFQGIQTSNKKTEPFDFESRALEIGRDQYFSFGLLAYRDRNGAGVIDHISAIAANIRSTHTDDSTLAPYEVRELIKELASPLSTTQDRHGTCAAEAISNKIFLENPAEWARYARELLTTGKAKTYATDEKGTNVPLVLPYDFNDDDISTERTTIAATLQAAVKTTYANPGWRYSNKNDNYEVCNQVTGEPITIQKNGTEVVETQPSGMEYQNEQKALNALLGQEYVQLIWGHCQLQPEVLQRGIFCSLKWSRGRRGNFSNHAVLLTAVDRESKQVFFRNPHRQQERSPGNLIYDDGPQRYAVDQETGHERMAIDDFVERANYIFVPRDVAYPKKQQGPAPIDLISTAAAAKEEARVTYKSHAHLSFAPHDQSKTNALYTASPNKPIVGVLKWTDSGFNIVEFRGYEKQAGRTILGGTVSLAEGVTLPREVMIFKNLRPTKQIQESNGVIRDVRAGDEISHEGPKRVVINPDEGLEAVKIDFLNPAELEILQEPTPHRSETNRRGWMKTVVATVVVGGVGAVAVNRKGQISDFFSDDGTVVGPDGSSLTGPLNTDQAQEVLQERLIGPRELHAHGFEVGSSPPPPPDTITASLLVEKCPIAQNGELVRRTHSLVLEPKGLTLRRLLQVLEDKHNVKVRFRYEPMGRDPVLDRPAPGNRWHLLCNATVPAHRSDSQFKGADLDTKLYRLKRDHPNYEAGSAVAVILSALPDLVDPDSAASSAAVRGPVVTSDSTLNPNAPLNRLCVAIDCKNKEIVFAREGDFGYSQTDLALERRL